MDYADPREIPAYTIAEAAHYLNMPPATVRAWVRGMGRFKPVIDLPNKSANLLSFFNLAEAQVLRAIRNTHGVKLPMVRKAIAFIRSRYGWKRPLIENQFKTDGVRLFIDHLGRLVDATGNGQFVMQEVMTHLDRIEWENGIASKIFPFTRYTDSNAPKSVLIDPRLSFGRPVLASVMIPTSVIAERYKAGDSIEELADDFACTRLDIEEGIRCELRVHAAA